LLNADSLLVILKDTGEERQGLPVFTYHPEPQPLFSILKKGFSGRLLRVYAFCQKYLHNQGGAQPEPAYLLLSDNEGGFARRGFYLDDKEKRDVGYVDLHRESVISGRFGALDQIFPHELGHLLLTQLGCLPGRGGSNQVHAIGVRTDPWTAFNEGFAEHFQIMAIDDPDAERSTAALSSDIGLQTWAEETVQKYAVELLEGPDSSLGLRKTFLKWFGRAEQVLRYSAVKKNLFSREHHLVGALLDKGDQYAAYLVENIVPGKPGDAPKRPGVMRASEGVVAAFFHRWIMACAYGLQGSRASTSRTCSASSTCGPSGRCNLCGTSSASSMSSTPHVSNASNRSNGSGASATARLPASIQKMFGIESGILSSVEAAYLKICHVLHKYRPGDVSTLISGYLTEFPEEENLLNSVISDVTGAQGFSSEPEIWLANPEFEIGTSVFDQYRALPRIHTFDLNGASLVDLCTIEGVDGPLAKRIWELGPYQSVDELRKVPGLTSELMRRFAWMESEMEKIRTHPDSIETDLLRKFDVIIKSYQAG